jgi:hypothetical protein
VGCKSWNFISRDVRFCQGQSQSWGWQFNAFHRAKADVRFVMLLVVSIQWINKHKILYFSFMHMKTIGASEKLLKAVSDIVDLKSHGRMYTHLPISCWFKKMYADLSIYYCWHCKYFCADGSSPRRIARAIWPGGDPKGLTETNPLRLVARWWSLKSTVTLIGTR